MEVEEAMSSGAESELLAKWENCVELVRGRIPSPYFSSIIDPLRPVSIDNGTLTVAAPNSFTKDIIESRFLGTLSTAASEAYSRQIDVTVTVASTPELLEIMAKRTHDAPPEKISDLISNDEAGIPLNGRSHQLTHPNINQQKKYTFENFVVGDSNKFAYNAAIMVAEVPGHNYNPLFIYGGTGLGKTHLLFAIKEYAEKLNPRIKIKYVQTSVFIDEFIATLTLKRDKATFDQKYINNRIVLFDDIQALSGTDAIQGKFFDIFNLLYGANSHIVVSSDRPPREMSHLSDRIQSRFEGGLMIDIKPPDLETRLAILRVKSRTEGLQIPDDVLIYIASNVNSNIRALEGLLNRVIASARLYGSRIDLPMVQDILRDQVIEPDQLKMPSIDVIQSLASNYFDISKEDLVSKSRSRSLVHGRQVAMYLCRELTNETLISIGNQFGNRDHSTVLHSCRKVESQIKNKKEVLEEVRELTNMINRSS